MTAKQAAAAEASALESWKAASAKRKAARTAADVARTAWNTASDAAWDADVAEYRARGVWTALQAAAKAAP